MLEMKRLKEKEKNIVSFFLEQYNFLEIVNWKLFRGPRKVHFFNVVDAGKILVAK